MNKNKDFSQALAYISTPNESKKEEKEVKEKVVSKPESEKEITKVDFTENRTKRFSMVIRPSMLHLLEKHSREQDISMSRIVERAIIEYLDI